MRVILCAALIGLFVPLAPVMAQSVRSIGGPAELPPSSFSGQQYVDSRGCVFMRAGLNGRTSWVPRIGRDRKPMCNETTAGQAAQRLAAPENVTVAAAPVTQEKVGKPVETVASQMVPKRQTAVKAPTFTAAPTPKVTAAAPVSRKTATTKPVSAGKPRSPGCPAHAPVLQRMALNAGGTVQVCTRGDGSATGWVSPSHVRGTEPVTDNTNTQSAAPQRQRAASQQSAHAVILAQNADFSQTVINGQVVQGYQTAKTAKYRAAFDDGRLNPLRGNGSAQGWAQQDQVLTRTTPANSIAEEARIKARKQVLAQARSRPIESSGQNLGAIFVQIGTFGNPANVQNAGVSLSAMGLPVAKRRSISGGSEVVTVYAGPFASTSDAQAALGMVRNAGFGDAFLR
jgi:hypothetical protein